MDATSQQTCLQDTLYLLPAVIYFPNDSITGSLVVGIDGGDKLGGRPDHFFYELKTQSVTRQEGKKKASQWLFKYRRSFIAFLLCVNHKSGRGRRRAKRRNVATLCRPHMLSSCQTFRGYLAFLCVVGGDFGNIDGASIMPTTENSQSKRKPI